MSSNSLCKSTFLDVAPDPVGVIAGAGAVVTVVVVVVLIILMVLLIVSFLIYHNKGERTMCAVRVIYW